MHGKIRADGTCSACGIDKNGLSGDGIRFSFDPDGSESYKAILRGEHGETLEERQLEGKDAAGFYFGAELDFGSRYTVTVMTDGGITAETEIETAEPLDAPFITTDPDIESPVFIKHFHVPRGTVRARLMITGVGLFRAFISGRRVGDDYLTPGMNDYAAYLRTYTYDVTNLLTDGENELSVHLGDGWYKGRYGIDKPEGKGGEVWGDRLMTAARLTFFDSRGKRTDITTNESWTAGRSTCVNSSIYDGETRDYRIDPLAVYACRIAGSSFRTTTYFGSPIKEIARKKPTLITSPKGEQILDFGANIVGFVRFVFDLPYGSEVILTHGEVLQDGCFYNANYRTAKAEARYISDGTERIAEPYFTYFGFRYVKVEGIAKVDPAKFEGVVLSSAHERAYSFCTSCEKLNKLIKNVSRSLEGNFTDIPTDCPQRDERLGWTADAQTFMNTACRMTNAYAFYAKYIADLRAEQTMYYSSDIPMYCPSLRGEAGVGGAVWGDAAVIMPWTLYMQYGDRKLLQKHYPLMKDYVATLERKDADCGDRGIIDKGFTFGDWLAQDGVSPQSLGGSTDSAFIMSTYYYNSVSLLSRAAAVIEISADAEYYSRLAEKIRSAVINEYFTKSGRFALDTQASYAIAVTFGLYPDEKMIKEQFARRLKYDLYKIKSGFAGTPLMLSALFSLGMDDEAYRLLTNESAPGWFYQINHGATTVWERWNSMLPDGTVSGTSMNSFNHYALGSVADAVFSYVAGLRQQSPAWESVLIEPHPNYRIKHSDISFSSPRGKWHVRWQTDGGKLIVSGTVPDGCRATLIMPDGSRTPLEAGDFAAEADGVQYLHPFSADSMNYDLMENAEAAHAIKEIMPKAYAALTGENEEYKIYSPRFFASLASFEAGEKEIAELDSRLRMIET